MAQVADSVVLKIVDIFSDTPGSRNVDEGKYSGEKFLKDILLPKFEEAIHDQHNLFIDLDDAEGYATSFLEEAFGGLARIHPIDLVLSTLEFKSDDEPLLIEEIKSYIQQARG
jgi:hypothetical protein